MTTVDSSVWIDFLNGIQSKQTEQLDLLLQDSSVDFVVLDVVLMEVLRGIRNEDDYENTRAALTALPVLNAGGESVALSAAHMYRKLRQNGITVRSSIDLWVAAWALNHDADLIHNDRDFAQISRLFPITAPI